MYRGSAPCHSATFAAASYFSEPVAALCTCGDSSLQTRSLTSGLMSVWSVKSRSAPEYPHRSHMCTWYAHGCAPAARSWKSVRLPPNQFVDTTVCDGNSWLHDGHRSSILRNAVILSPITAFTGIREILCHGTDLLRAAVVGQPAACFARLGESDDFAVDSCCAFANAVFSWRRC